MTAPLKSRFSPSPTGLMHIGNLRTALFNALLAKSSDTKGEGVFLLRIEDTDLERSKSEFVEKLILDLKWMGLDWQEGPGKGNEAYFQSQRQALYENYYQQLIEKEKAYWCFCSEETLKLTRKSQLAQGQPPRYPGTCRHLSAEKVKEKRAKGEPCALRFKLPSKEHMTFKDFIQGDKTFASDDIGDFIIKKADHTPAFMFCNAVDDALMGVTHVMRGEDHLTNTPRQLFILKALNLRSPQYGHMPLIVGFDGKPLSKRNGSQSVAHLREQGYFPLAIANYLARLGHHFESHALLSLKDLGEHFSHRQIGRAPARFDMLQLQHWQKERVLKLTDEDFWAWIEPEVTPWVSRQKAMLFTQAVKQNVLLPLQAKTWAKQLLTNEVIYAKEAISAIKEAGTEFIQTLYQLIDKDGDYATIHKNLSELTGKKGAALFKPLRAIITGQLQGPELNKLFILMGKKLLLARTHQAQALIKETQNDLR